MTTCAAGCRPPSRLWPDWPTHSWAGAPLAEAKTAAESEVGLLRSQFADTPYSASGGAATAAALAKLVGRVEWVAGNAALSGVGPAALESPPVREMIETVAETLRRCAALICDGAAHPVDDPDRHTRAARVEHASWRTSSTPRSTSRCPA